MNKVFDTSPVAARQHHDLGLQASFGGIAGDGLGADIGGGLVVSGNPWRQSLIGHFSSKISIYSSKELVV